MTWQAVPLRAATLLDAPRDRVLNIVLRVDVWQRCAAACGLRLAVSSTAQQWDPAGTQVRVSRAGRASSATIRLVDGVPGMTFTDGPARDAQLRLVLDETGAGLLVTADFGNPHRSTGASARAAAIRQSRHRRSIVGALETLLGMIRLELHQTRLVVAGALLRDSPQRAVLAARRAYPAALAGRWEFPGGKVDDGEQPHLALRRELAEELGVTASIGEQIGPEVAIGLETVLRLYAVTVPEVDSIASTEHDELRWLGAAELGDVDWLTPDIALLPALRAVLISD